MVSGVSTLSWSRRERSLAWVLALAVSGFGCTRPNPGYDPEVLDSSGSGASGEVTTSGGNGEVPVGTGMLSTGMMGPGTMGPGTMTCMEVPTEVSADWSRSAIDVVDTGVANRIEVLIELEHPNIGDVVMNLIANMDDGPLISAYLSSTWQCEADGIEAMFGDVGTSLEASCPGDGAVVTRMIAPVDALAIFDGWPVAGNWYIDIRDENRDGMDDGVLRRWCLIY